MKLIKKQFLPYIFAIMTFLVFYYISSRTPLAGDDWAFANNANTSGVIGSALGMFKGWEGRFLTLVSMHFFIQFPSLWVIMNALMYALIVFIIYQITNQNKQVVIGILLFFLMFSIKDNIRMEVYTWMTGSIYYGIPLFMAIVYIYILQLTEYGYRTKIWHYILIVAPSLYLPLGMENISIAILILNVYLLIEFYVCEHQFNRFFGFSLVLMIISFYIWSLSPGSAIRLATMPEWTNLSFMGKVFRQLPEILNFTFFQNKELIVILGLILSYVLFKEMKSKLKYVSISVYFFSMVIVAIPSVISIVGDRFDISFILESTSAFNQVFWTVYALNLITNTLYLNYARKYNRLIYPVIIAFFSSAALFMSPVIGYRLMVYPVFFLTIYILMIVSEIEINKRILIPLLAIFMVATLQNLNVLRIKYNSVQAITQERMAILADYELYADQYESGIWLPRYPIYTIHGGDIEIEDVYHMKAFKQYFDLPQDEEIVFYWKEQY